MGFILLALPLVYVFFLWLSMIEVVSGRLIGPKSWNRGVEVFKTHLDSPLLSTDYLGC